MEGPMKLAAHRLRAAALPLLVVALSVPVGFSLSGCDNLFNIDRVEVPPNPPGEDNGYMCTCTCNFSGGSGTLPLSVCAPAGLNPNVPDGVAPTAQQLADDCTNRVQVQVQRLSNQCYSPNPGCTCTAGGMPDTFYDASCDDPCAAA